MYREAAKWLETHELCKDGTYFGTDGPGAFVDTPINYGEIKQACIKGSILVALESPDYPTSVHHALRAAILRLYPEDHTTLCLHNVTGWNDLIATKEQAIAVLNECAMDAGEPA